jgi:hypothetical protein
MAEMGAEGSVKASVVVVRVEFGVSEGADASVVLVVLVVLAVAAVVGSAFAAEAGENMALMLPPEASVSSGSIDSDTPSYGPNMGTSTEAAMLLCLGPSVGI